MEDRSQLKNDLVELLFATPNPCIARFPHVLVRGGQSAVRAVSASMGSLVGLWGEAPLLRADGSHYMEPESGRIDRDFVLWKLAANQKYLLDRANVGPDPSFRMFIAADTPIIVLTRTYEHFDRDQGAPWFGDYINYVCEWLNDLQWVLIPLEGETGWCIFAAAQGQVGLIEKARSEFRQHEISTAHLDTLGPRFRWVDDEY